MKPPTSIAEKDLSIQLSKAHRRVLHKYTKHQDVTNVLCVMSPLSGSPRLIPVGDGLEYDSVDAALAAFGETASELFVVDAEAAPLDRAVNGVKHKSKSEATTEKTQVDESQRVRELTERLKEAEGKIAELMQLKELQSALEEYESNLNSREESLMRMEEELMERMHQHMERVAEVEQREDNVAEREVFLGEKSHAG